VEPNAEHTGRYTVREAAEKLGISPEAVRSRLNRGTLQRETGGDGTVYVLIRTDHTTDHSSAQVLLVERLDSEVRYLRDQLQQANERDREQRRIIAALTSRIPALPSAGESPAAAPTEAAQQQPSEGVQVSWWRRVFGG
jgi:predicted ArsR family transcriptional regulator